MFDWKADNNGNRPKEGDYVAFNWSSQIALGHIRRIGKSHTGRQIFYITRSAPSQGQSVIRGGAKCLLVLSPSQPEVRRRNLERHKTMCDQGHMHEPRSMT